ncbi:MAG: transporter [Gemmatimonadetes bacterium]|nr:transporter [Gemmatimonadota bacterium]
MHRKTSVSVWLFLVVGPVPVLAGGPHPVAGQGLPFHTPSALTTAFEERGVRVFSMVQSRGDMTGVVIPLVILPFAPHQRLTTTVKLPLTYKRMRDPGGAAGGTYSEGGIGDLGLSAKFAFFVRNRFAGTTRVALILGASLPTGSTSAKMNDGLPAPRPLQLGTGALSGGVTIVTTIVRNRWGLNAAVGHVRHGTDDGFHFGATTRYDLALSVRVPEEVETIRTRTVQLYLEWNGSIQRQATSDGDELADTGGHVGYLSPGIQWVVLPQLLIEGSLQIPLLQDHNGAQPDYGVRPAIGARFLFF